MSEQETKSKKELYMEKKAERQALKEKEIKKAQKAMAKKNKGYKNPINSIGGKILVWTLCFAMLFGILFSFVYLIFIK